MNIKGGALRLRRNTLMKHGKQNGQFNNLGFSSIEEGWFKFKVRRFNGRSSGPKIVAIKDLMEVC